MASIGIAESISTMVMASIVAWLVSLQPTRLYRCNLPDDTAATYQNRRDQKGPHTQK